MQVTGDQDCLGKVHSGEHSCERCSKALPSLPPELTGCDTQTRSPTCPVCQQHCKCKDRRAQCTSPTAAPSVGEFSRWDHLNSHTHKRLFKCDTCEAAFAMKNLLQVHTVGHEENIPCYMCGKMLRAAYILGHMKVPFLGPHHVCECSNKDTFEDCPRAAGAVAVTVSMTPTPQLWAPCQGRGDAPGALRHSPHSPAELHLGGRESGRGRKVP